jgi:hypothetical protein
MTKKKTKKETMIRVQRRQRRGCVHMLKYSFLLLLLPPSHHMILLSRRSGERDKRRKKKTDVKSNNTRVVGEMMNKMLFVISTKR